MRSGVAIVESKSMNPPCTFSTRSSAPTTSAPASRASRSFSPLANTATRTVLPMPWGSTMAPRTIWSACLGSTPSRIDRSTVSSNLAAGAFLTMSMASSTEYGFARSISASVALIRFVITGMSVRSLSIQPSPRDAPAFGRAAPQLVSTQPSPRDAPAFGRAAPQLVSTQPSPRDAPAFGRAAPPLVSTQPSPRDAPAFGRAAPQLVSTQPSPRDAPAFGRAAPQLELRLNDVDAHAAGGAFDGAHGRVDGIRVQVHELGLRDLAHLGPRHLADLVLVRHGRRLGDARRPLQQDGCGGSLDHEGEGPVGKDRDHHGEDQTLLGSRLGVEALAEFHDVHAVLAEGRPHGGRRVGLARGNLQLHHRLDFLRHALEPLHLVVLELHRGHPSEDGHHDLELAALRVEVVDRALEVHERPLDDPHLVALLEGRLELGLLRPLLHLLEDALDLLGRQGHGLGARADEARHLRCRAHEVPRVVGQLHLHEQVAGEELLLRLDLLALPDLAHLLRGHDDAAEEILEAEDLGPRLDGRRHLVLEPRIGVDDEPLLRGRARLTHACRTSIA